MLRRPSLQKPFFGILVEHECPRCQRPVELPLGEFCRTCRQEIDQRAGKIARWVAAVTTVMVGAYVYFRMPVDPTARMVGGISIAAWYLLTNLVVRRVLREHLR